MKLTPKSFSCCSESSSSRKRQLQNGHARRRVSDDQGGRRARRQLPQLGLRNRGHLRDGLLDLRVRLKENLHHRNPVQRLRLDMLDVVDGGRERAFGHENDAVGHVLGVESVIIPDDAHDRNVDVGKDIGWRTDNGERTQNQKQRSRPPQMCKAVVERVGQSTYLPLARLVKSRPACSSYEIGESEIPTCSR